MKSSPSSWTVFAFCLYSLACLREVVWKTYQLGVLYLVKKVSFLTWETILLTYLYLTVKTLCPGAFQLHVKNKLYLVCLSLNSIVVLAYWSLYSVDPKLVDSTDYKEWDIEWVSTLFSHGVDLAVLIVEGFMIRDTFNPPGMRWFIEVELLFTTLYCCVQWICRQITGEAVYGFLDAMSFTEVFTFYLVLGLVSMAVKAVASFTLTRRGKAKVN